MKKLIAILLLASAVSVFAQDRNSRGTWSRETHILATTTTDTTMIDSVSLTYNGYPTETIYYKFLDTGTVATTLYFEAQVQGRLYAAEWCIIDSLVVAATSTAFQDWNITDAAIGVHDKWRLRKSATTDTLIAIHRGYAEK
jgi:hypothetical protein